MTNSPTLTCRTEGRRDKVRAAGLNGIDYVEVIGTDQRELRVYFLGKVPHGIHKANVLIEGGRRIRDIRVTHAEPRPAEEEDRDDSLLVTVDRAGDFSTYTLRIVEAHDRKPTGKPYHQFDPRYSRAEFSFKAGCPSDLDCTAEPDYPPPTRQQPDINYLAKDYASFRQLILDRLALIMPDWQERHVPDIGITLVELLAYVGDYLSYYQDAVGTEAYLGTARRRISVRRHARLVDYTLHEGCNARAWVCLDVSEDTKLPKDAFFAVGLDSKQITIDEFRNLPAGTYEVFEPLEPLFGAEIPLYEKNSKIPFYTWGDDLCCLPPGATGATLLGELADPAYPDVPGKIHLRTGDVLIFEEVIGPRTGLEADADPARRWAVRLTKVKGGMDEVCKVSVVEIEWAREDALPFPFCISARRPAPWCNVVPNISVVRGNVVLVDHGRTVDEKDSDPVGGGDAIGECACDGSVLEMTRLPAPFSPTLKQAPLTFSVPLRKRMPASAVPAQNPREALPQVTSLTDTTQSPWTPQADLLASRSDDRHFVVEIDDEGRAHLRFGDGDSGRKPDAGLIFSARYRVGNGPAG
ncbi:MAG: putative baseplate assembly protein, partial [Chthoniobacteraceae bacterium]